MGTSNLLVTMTQSSKFATLQLGLLQSVGVKVSKAYQGWKLFIWTLVVSTVGEQMKTNLSYWWRELSGCCIPKQWHRREQKGVTVHPANAILSPLPTPTIGYWNLSENSTCCYDLQQNRTDVSIKLLNALLCTRKHVGISINDRHILLVT